MADYYLDEEWCLKNKDTIQQLSDSPENFIKFFDGDPTHHLWDILPDKNDILSEYNSKLAHTKSLSGCSSCMVNSLKNRYISKLNDILSNARRVISRHTYNDS